ncbi:MAG: hypothetical protein AAB418_01985 [candidate division NC10 bacterium]|jgi:hypothetical protein
MTMDLWYDLAARELPDLDEEMIEKLELVEVAHHAPEAEREAAGAVDFF